MIYGPKRISMRNINIRALWQTANRRKIACNANDEKGEHDCQFYTRYKPVLCMVLESVHLCRPIGPKPSPTSTHNYFTDGNYFATAIFRHPLLKTVVYVVVFGTWRTHKKRR